MTLPTEALEAIIAGLGNDTFAGITRTAELKVPVVRAMATELLAYRRAGK